MSSIQRHWWHQQARASRLDTLKDFCQNASYLLCKSIFRCCTTESWFLKNFLPGKDGSPRTRFDNFEELDASSYLHWGSVFQVGYSGKSQSKSGSWSQSGRSKPRNNMTTQFTYCKSISFWISEDRIVSFAEVYLEAFFFVMKGDFTARQIFKRGSRF